MTSHMHHVFLIPGMFGFGTLAGYEYFGHFERALESRFRDAGVPLRMSVVLSPATASIRRRSSISTEMISRTAASTAGPIHLLGHSTGGLDARLMTSPSAVLHVEPESLDWIPRVRTVITLNTPHYGTPLAGFFATVSGTRLLYAISLLTVVTLSVGSPPLTALSRLVATVSTLDDALGLDLQLIDRSTRYMLRFLGERARDEVRLYLQELRADQGGIIQISPEAMDLFNASVGNRQDVRYGCVATCAPAPRALGLVRALRGPYAAMSAMIYSTLYQFVARADPRYPYAALVPELMEALEATMGAVPHDGTNDGVVPTRSMLWGDLLWSGMGDHLDVVGHFLDDEWPVIHKDWLTSGANFTRTRFEQLVDAIAAELLRE